MSQAVFKDFLVLSVLMLLPSQWFSSRDLHMIVHSSSPCSFLHVPEWVVFLNTSTHFILSVEFMPFPFPPWSYSPSMFFLKLFTQLVITWVYVLVPPFPALFSLSDEFMPFPSLPWCYSPSVIFLNVFTLLFITSLRPSLLVPPFSALSVCLSYPDVYLFLYF